MTDRWLVRAAKPGDEVVIKALWSYCFSADGPDFVAWYFDRYFDLSETIVVENAEGEVLGSTQLIRQTLDINGEDLPIRYVVGVDSFPEARGRGAVAAMMKWLLTHSDVPLLFLMPFEAGFYYHYGFVFGDMHSQLTLPIEEVRPLARQNGVFQRVMPETVRTGTLLNDVYERWQGRYFDVHLKRTPRRWSAVIDDLALEGGHVAVLRDDAGEISGYILYRLLGDTFAVRELAYLNATARAALYDYIFTHRSQCSRLEWSAPASEPLIWSRPTDKTGVTRFPFMMMRLVDPTCVERFAVKVPEETIVWTVLDEYMNTSQYFRWGPETVGIERLETVESTDFTLSVEALTALVFSELPAAQALETVSLSPAGASKLKTFTACFKRLNTYFNEYF